METVSNDEELCIQNEKLCIKNEENRIVDIKDDGFCRRGHSVRCDSSSLRLEGLREDCLLGD